MGHPSLPTERNLVGPDSNAIGFSRLTKNPRRSDAEAQCELTSWAFQMALSGLLTMTSTKNSVILGKESGLVHVILVFPLVYYRPWGKIGDCQFANLPPEMIGNRAFEGPGTRPPLTG